MKLLFENSKGIERVIAFPNSEEEAIEEIHKFAKERNFKIYYMRMWDENGMRHYDIGSHSEFFRLKLENNT